MALIKITFDSASVTSKQDAECNHFLVSGQNGRIIGLGGNLAVTTSNNYINLASGYVQVYGRRVFVEQNTKIQVALNGSAYGYVFIKYDMANNTVTLDKKETTGGYPNLVQDNLLTGGMIYELPVARYTKTSSSLNLDTNYNAPTIKNSDALAAERVSNSRSQVDYAYGPLYQRRPTSKSGKFFTFAGIHSSNADKGVGHVQIGLHNVFFSTWAAAASAAIYQYKFNGSTYDAVFSLTSSGLIIETASSAHEPEWVYVSR
jgi:hypothetical protein